MNTSLSPDKGTGNRQQQGCGWLTTAVAPISTAAREAARERQNRLTKPPGSLGQLEGLAVTFAGWQHDPLPDIDRCQVRVFAGDHGLVAEGVSAFPQSVTVEMLRNFARGGAAISVLNQALDADFRVINLGTAHPLPVEDQGHPAIQHLQLAPGTANMCTEPAMTGELLAAALLAGAEAVFGVERGVFIGGEMGIGNTAATAALTCALLDLPAQATVGRGTGVDDDGLARKRRAVDRALTLHKPYCISPLETLRRLGGLEIAALTGAYTAAAQKGMPSLVDGYICTAAALIACLINPAVRDWLLFAHCSAEPGHRFLLKALAARPLLDLDMRLGEGSGAAIALPLLQVACRLHGRMATFEEAEVSGHG